LSEAEFASLIADARQGDDSIQATKAAAVQAMRDHMRGTTVNG